MNLIFTQKAWDDYLYWQKSDKAVIKRINLLISNILRTPFSGIGKPEPLKFELTGFWSRRIDQKHRLIYKVEDDCLYIIACRFHYKK